MHLHRQVPQQVPQQVQAVPVASCRQWSGSGRLTSTRKVSWLLVLAMRCWLFTQAALYLNVAARDQAQAVKHMTAKCQADVHIVLGSACCTRPHALQLHVESTAQLA